MVASTAPPCNDELTARQNEAGSDSGVKSEDVKLQRAQRNRESAKRSRLKSKLLHQKMTATYDRLRDENRALKGLVEKLVEECRSAPPEVQDRLRTIIHEKQSMKDKQGAMHGVLY
jgi:Basic region leucine zipper